MKLLPTARSGIHRDDFYGSCSPVDATDRRITGRQRRSAANSSSEPTIRKFASGQYRWYSLKVDPKTGRRRNPASFESRADAEKHEREARFFKRRG